MEEHEKIRQGIRKIYRLFIGIFSLFAVLAIAIIYMLNNPDALSRKKNIPEAEYVAVPEEEDYDKIENGIHLRTGLLEAEGLTEVINNCTNCHSAKLVMQNRMNKERWIATIRWMQETQNLWDLGNNEEIIVNYLVTNYPSKKKGRREILTDIEWYALEQ
ncbi:monoheme cytochrome C [Maribacter sp. ACAM166]|uniref:monoheme cytochrome C n=1 Tax=Maribacter sp. ACAM166 TaxID=2508996 RepID=UPI0010FE5497|nr:monoheme cytochrome C [Maribacter sp. ACAM166]TLP81711.1 monoheme cytochrome C [Maribacter sp. ACAM166]